jgi:hypothetical protein
MPESNQTDQLLTEIRDLLALHEEKYDEHLEKVREADANQLSASQARSRTWALIQWSGVFVAVYLAVYFAMRSLH